MKTTLIIGAGSNADFQMRKTDDNKEEDIKPINMPTGEELVRKIEEFGNKIIDFCLPKFVFDDIDKQYGGVVTAKLGFAEIFSKANVANTQSRNYRDFLEGYLMASVGQEAINNIKKFSQSDAEKHIVFFLERRFFSQKPAIRYYSYLSKLINIYDPVSIDNFLAQINDEKIDIKSFIKIEGNETEKEIRENLIKAGKELITFILLIHEDNKIFTSQNKIWYRWLQHAILNCAPTIDEICQKIKDDFSIISFNYDRSLEFFLKEKLKPKIYQSIKKKIIYPYGSLNFEPDQEEKYHKAIKENYGEDIPYTSRPYKPNGVEVYGAIKKIYDSLGDKTALNDSHKKANSFEAIGDLFLNENSFLKQIAQNIRVVGERQNGAVAKPNFL